MKTCREANEENAKILLRSICAPSPSTLKCHLNVTDHPSGQKGTLKSVQDRNSLTADKYQRTISWDTPCGGRETDMYRNTTNEADDEGKSFVVR